MILCKKLKGIVLACSKHSIWKGLPVRRVKTQLLSPTRYTSRDFNFYDNSCYLTLKSSMLCCSDTGEYKFLPSVAVQGYHLNFDFYKKYRF